MKSIKYTGSVKDVKGLYQVTVKADGKTIYVCKFSRLQTAQDDLRQTLESYRSMWVTY